MRLRQGTSQWAWLAAALVAFGAVAPATSAAPAARTAASELSVRFDGGHTFELPRRATHVALHWRGADDARLRVATSRDGRQFGRYRVVRLDEVGEHRRGGETYGAVMRANRARALRVRGNRRLTRLTVVAMTDRGRRGRANAAAHIGQPAVIPRSGWGADESLRFDSGGQEVWPAEFWPVQKLFVHHTAGANNDPDPAATIRSIYYYHAVTQGWGDIGYNFLVDEAGNVYEGRWSRAYAAGEQPTGENLAGEGVTGAHAQGYNSGTVGVALLGTLTDRDATPAARNALESMLAWKADRHALDPQGASLYTNPVSGTQRTFANIAGHRDVNATECPGSVFYATLPDLRASVAARITGTTVTRLAPEAYTLEAGSVVKGRGGVARLDADDGARVEIGAAKSSGSYTAAIQPYARVDGDPATLRRLTVDYDGGVSNSRAEVTLMVRDQAAGTWVSVDGPRTAGSTRDRSFTWSTASPASFVSAAGELRFRIRATNARSFTSRTDLVRFSVER